MRTPQDWKEEFFVELAETEPSTIARIQADSRAGMIEVSELDSVIKLLSSYAHRDSHTLVDKAIDLLKALRNEHTS